jgi:hypothetical protein
MKKTIIVVLVIALVVSLGLGIFYKIKIARLSIENVLPEDVMLFVRISEIEKSLQEFQSTQLWSNIKDIDIELLLEKSGLTKDEVERYRRFKTEFFHSLAEMFIDNFFGQEVAVAVYPTETTAGGTDSLFELGSNIILVTRLKPEAQFINFLNKLLNKFGQKVQTKYERYKNYQITLVELNDQVKLGYVKIKDLLIIGLGKKAASICIDVFSKERAALTEDKDYNFIMSQFSRSAQTIAYVNLESFIAILRLLIEFGLQSAESTAVQKRQILASFDKMAGLKTAGFASVAEKISQTKMLITFDKTQMPGPIKKMYSFQPLENKSIDFVPKNIIAYSWNNCFSAKSSWNELLQELEQNREQFSQTPATEEIVSGLEEQLGMSIEDDIIPALGNEVGGFLYDINLDSPIPIPELVLFIKIEDVSTIENVLVNITQRYNVLIKQEEYKGTNIKYIAFATGVDAQPAYCFLDDYLLISTKRTLLKESVRTFHDKSLSLVTHRDFQAVNYGLTDKNNSIFFLRTDMLILKIRRICGWGVSWLSLLSKDIEGYQQKIEQDLDNLRAIIQIEKQEIKWLQTNVRLLQEEVANIKSQDLEISEQRSAEIEKLENKIKTKETKVTLTKKDLEKKEKELADLKKRSLSEATNLALVQLYLNEIVYPILDGLGANKAIGSRSVLSENMCVLQSFSKFE